jgi:hypothetical protein
MSVIVLPDDDLVMFRPSLYPPVQESESGLATNYQQISAAGARWQVQIDLRKLPDHRYEAWSKLYVQGGVFRWPIPQPGYAPDDAGTPVVDGANQLGTSLSLRGLPPGYGLAANRWLTVTTAGVPRTYQITDAATADGTGRVTVTVNAPIRRAPSDGDAVELVAPFLQGQVTFSAFSRSQGFSRTDPFVLRER